MEFHNVARYFDTDPVLDGYSGAAVFSAQTASFDDSSSDGATNRRRVLSLAPGLTVPARRVVSMYGDRWVVGTGTPDGFGGSVIRQHFTMKRVTDLMAVLTPAQALAAAAGTAAYVQKVYFKDIVNTLTDSEYDTQWNIFIAPDEPASKGTILRDEDGRLYRVRNDYLPVEGLRVLQSDALDTDALQSCSFDTGTFNPVTEETTAGTTVVNGIWLDVPKFYRFRHVSDSKVEPGDCAVLVPTSVTVTPGTVFSMLSKNWKVLTVQAEGDAQALHARLA